MIQTPRCEALLCKTISFDLTHILLRVFSLSEVSPIWLYSWRRVFAEEGVWGVEARGTQRRKGRKEGEEQRGVGEGSGE